MLAGLGDRAGVGELLGLPLEEDLARLEGGAGALGLVVGHLVGLLGRLAALADALGTHAGADLRAVHPFHELLVEVGVVAHRLAALAVAAVEAVALAVGLLGELGGAEGVLEGLKVADRLRDVVELELGLVE